MNYDKAIAAAARDYVARKATYDWTRSESDCVKMIEARSKLIWMVDAEKYKWNPDDYKSEIIIP